MTVHSAIAKYTTLLSYTSAKYTTYNSLKLHVCQLQLLHTCELGKMRLLTEKGISSYYTSAERQIPLGHSEQRIVFQYTVQGIVHWSSQRGGGLETIRGETGKLLLLGISIARLPTPTPNIIFLNIHDF